MKVYDCVDYESYRVLRDQDDNRNTKYLCLARWSNLRRNKDTTTS